MVVRSQELSQMRREAKQYRVIDSSANMNRETNNTSELKITEFQTLEFKYLC